MAQSRQGRVQRLARKEQIEIAHMEAGEIADLFVDASGSRGPIWHRQGDTPEKPPAMPAVFRSKCGKADLRTAVLPRRDARITMNNRCVICRITDAEAAATNEVLDKMLPRLS